MPNHLNLVCAALLVAVMGFAVQRGATCCVAAVDELISRRRADRLMSMLLASAWVAAGLWCAYALGFSSGLPRGYGVTWATVAGAAALGYGAYVNGACVFGAVARLGSGQWVYALTIPGFWLGCLVMAQWPSSSALTRDLDRQTGAIVSVVSAVVVVASLVRWWRGEAKAEATANPARAPNVWAIWQAKVWSPVAATTVIGLTFTAVFLLVGGRWAYTDVLSDWAMQRFMDDGWRALLLLALFAGAVYGGWTAGRFAWARPTWAQAAQCTLGGALMGIGSALIPGSNDGLMLVGLPFLWPYAWLGILVMFASIALPMLWRQARSAT